MLLSPKQVNLLINLKKDLKNSRSDNCWSELFTNPKKHELMLINRGKLIELNQINEENVISIYCKTHRAGNADGDKIRWKNVCNELSDKLKAIGMEDRDIRRKIRPATDLLKKEDFWSHLSDGLCMFIHSEGSDFYQLPIAFENDVYLNTKPILAPLISYFSLRKRFFLLDLSLNHIRLFEGNQHSLTFIKIDDLVKTDYESLATLKDPQPNIQARSGGLFHGQGSGKDKQDAIMTKYLKMIDESLWPIFQGEDIPMVLSGDTKIVAEYKSSSRYKHILEDNINGNHEHTDLAVLHELAWNRIIDSTDKAWDEMSENIGYAKSQMLTTSSLTEIADCVNNANVDFLVVDFDQLTNVKQENGILLNDIIMNTFSKGLPIVADTGELDIEAGILLVKKYLRKAA